MENLDQKTAALIGIGVAYALNCQHCMEYHKEAALQAGAALQEMLAAVAMGEKVRNGAHDHAKRGAEDVFDNLRA